MTKLDYFFLSLQHNLILKRTWLLVTFTIQPNELATHISEEIFLSINNKILYTTINNKQEIIEDYIPGKPLYSRNELVNITHGQLKCLKEDITTSYGILLLNSILIEYPYEGLVPYANIELTDKNINKIAKNALDIEKVTVTMHLKFENAISYITVLATAGVPSATEKSIAPNKLIKELKESLFKQYANQLKDPAILADIQKQIQTLDKEYLSGDASERFLVTNNAVLSRLKTQGLMGAENDFIDESKVNVITRSLDEGWKAEDIPILANSLRGGSYNRGSNTALGGYQNKIVGRIFQNYKIVDDDCFTTLGLTILINEDNYSFFVGRYLVNEDKPLTIEKLKTLQGKTIIIRDPTFCNSPNVSFCKKCFGHAVADSNVGLTAKMTTITSVFLSLFLALFHNSVLITQKYNYHNRIT